MFGFVKRIACAACALALLTGFVLVQPVAAEAGGLPEITAESYVVMDLATGQVLMARDEESVRFPASITKIMTLGLAQEALNEGRIELDTQVEVSQRAVTSLISGASTIYLEAGEVVSVRDLMYGTHIRSANDAANVLAELLGGSIEGFAAMMNQKAAQLGLVNTHFTNPHGLPDTAHTTTAYDMAAITAWAMSLPGFAGWFGSTAYDMPGTNLHPEVRLLGTNNFMLMEDSDFYYEGITGSKSGYISDAGYTLVTTAERDGLHLAVVVLRSETNDSKYTDTAALLDYTFAHFGLVQYTPAGFEGASLPVYGGGEEAIGEVRVLAAGSVQFLLMDRLSVEDVQVEYSLPDRYVVGGDFAPVANISIPNSAGQYTHIASIPLPFVGLDGVMAANTTAFSNRGAARGGSVGEVLGTILYTVLITFVVLVAGRIVYVQLRRKRRARLRAQRLRQRQAALVAARKAATRGRTVDLQVYRAGQRRVGQR